MPPRREAALVEGPTVRRALHELLVPSIPLKLKSGVDTGWNDTLFLIPGGKPLFVEFKWLGYTPDPKQVYKHALLEELGYDCQTHDNVQVALCAIAEKVVSSRLSKEGRAFLAGTRGSGAILGPRFGEDQYLARSIQFLAEKASGKQSARYRPLARMLPSMAKGS